jgi:hypothetical protein
MAIFKSNMLSAIRGSVNGTVYSQNKSGPYMRNRSMVVNPNTASQVLARATFAQASQQWRTLTDAQRNSWRAYAAATPVTNRLGDTIFLSGANMFTKTNAFNGFLGIAAQTTAPITPGLAEGPSLDEGGELTDTASLNPNTLQNQVFDTGSTNIAAIYAFWISNQLSVGAEFYGGPWNFVGTKLGTTRNVELEIPAPMSPLVVGQHYKILCRIKDELGRLSAAQIIGDYIVENVP